ncbi:hypothetical protein [Brevundimonas sp.]|uniref:hypothetical protein n=1 Tax=Brevundimonas sp. TaxID=1871086 RepID=UPI002FCB3647
MIPDVAIGAILAALIAGLVSLLGLIVSKEQKTSEFRQSWIDALREEMAVYAASINTLHDALLVTYKDFEHKHEKMSSVYHELNKATFRIELRVNPKEAGHTGLLNTMSDIREIASDANGITLEALKPLEAKFIADAQAILKSEWRRVKRGELAFVIAKWAALVFVVVASISIGILVLGSAKNPSALGSQPPPTTVESRGAASVDKGAGGKQKIGPRSTGLEKQS